MQIIAVFARLSNPPQAWRSIRSMELYEEHIYNLLGQYMNAMLEFFMHHYVESATMFQECIDMISPVHGQVCLAGVVAQQWRPTRATCLADGAHPAELITCKC